MINNIKSTLLYTIYGSSIFIILVFTGIIQTPPNVDYFSLPFAIATLIYGALIGLIIFMINNIRKTNKRINKTIKEINELQKENKKLIDEIKSKGKY